MPNYRCRPHELSHWLFEKSWICEKVHKAGGTITLKKLEKVKIVNCVGMRRRREVRQENHKILMTFSTPSQRHRSRLNFTNPRSPPWQTSQQKHNNFIYLNFTHNKTTLCDFVTDILEIYPCDVTHTAGVHTNTSRHAATAADSHWQCWPEKSVGSRKRVSNIVLNNFSSCCSLSSSLQDRGEGCTNGQEQLGTLFSCCCNPGTSG